MKSYYGGPIGTHQRAFERYHPNLLQAPLPQDWGFGTPIQNCNRYYLTISQERVKLYGLQIWPIYSHVSIRTKAREKFGRKGAWAHPGTAQIFWVPPIISGMNFKFCTHVHRIDRNKSPLKISTKAVGVLGDSRKLSGHPYIGRVARSSL